MKKTLKVIVLALLALLMTFSAVSCVTPEENVPDDPTNAPITASPEPTEEPTQVNYDAYDYTEKKIGAAELFPYCKTQGRTVIADYTFRKSNPSVTGIALDYSAASIEFNAVCEGKVTAFIKVKSTGIGGSRLYISVYVDGVQMGTSRGDFRLTKSTGTEVVLAENLERGLHNIRIERQTEAERGLMYIDEITLSGQLAEKPADSRYFIEFIGDSITTGYGNLWPDDSDGETSTNAAYNEYVDGTRSYAVLAAKTIGADYSVVAQQGIALVKGWQPHTMTDTYTETCYQCDRHEEWTFPRKADVVVINLGTNDASFYHSGQVSLDAIEKGIRKFLDIVREKNPDAKILWVYGMMDTFLCSYIEKAIKEKGGESAGYYYLQLSPNGSGGNGHPNLKAHKQNGKTLANKLKEILNIA